MPIASLFQRCWRSRWIRFVTYLGAAVIALLVGLTVWMNYKGGRDWKAAQAMLASEGVELDFTAMKAAPVPDAENFCAIPLLKGITAVEDDDETKGESAAKRKALDALGPPPYHAAFPRPSVTRKEIESAPLDFQEWADWFRNIGHPMPVTDSGSPAREVLAALSYQDAPLAQMVAVLDRPTSRFEPDWRNGPFPELLVSRGMPHLAAIQSCSMGLALRAKAGAQAGEAAQAHEAALVLARLTEATIEEPFVTSLVVGVTSSTYLSRVVCEFGHAHCGTAEDFHRLQQALNRIDIREATVRAFKEEIAVGVNATFYMSRRREHASPWFQGVKGESALKLTGWIIPGGWFDSNAAAIANLTLDFIVRPLRDRGWPDAVASQRSLEQYLNRARAEFWWNTDSLMALLMMPTHTRIVERAAYAQCLLDQAIIACALEGHRIEYGSYPNTLGDLLRPGRQPLPKDILSGAPMGYRKTEDGRYVLWAVGYDGVDDGGTRPERKGATSKPTHREYQGDWAWDFPKPERTQVPEPKSLKTHRSRVKKTKPSN